MLIIWQNMPTLWESAIYPTKILNQPAFDIDFQKVLTKKSRKLDWTG